MNRRSAAVVVVLVYASIGTAAARQSRQPPASAPEDTPVELTRKNIQVLQGLKESQLFGTMNLVADALGVRCDYCHVTEGDKWIWDRDDKPTKIAARRMIRLTLDLNRTTFNGATKITCYSCHRGAVTVSGVPAIPPPPAPPRSPDRPLPTVEAILTKYAGAVGSSAPGARIDATTFEATERRGNRTAQITIAIKGSDRLRLTRSTPQGVAEQALTGADGWTSGENGVQPLSRDGVVRLKRVRALLDAVKIDDPPTHLRVVGVESIGGRQAYAVRAEANPPLTMTYYFDEETGLLLRALVLQDALLGPIPEQVDFSDYRPVDGVKLPFSLTVSGANASDTAVWTFTSIKHVPLDDALFQRPAGKSQ